MANIRFSPPFSGGNSIQLQEECRHREHFLATAMIISVLFLSCGDRNSSTNGRRPDNKGMVETTRQTDYTLESKFNAFDTSIEVIFTNTRDTASDCQNSSFKGFQSKQEIIAADLINKVFEYYKEVYPNYKEGWMVDGRLSKQQQEDNFPTPTTAQNLKRYYSPEAIYIPSRQNCEPGTFGIYLSCTWDIKSDLGVVVRNWKVVEVGTGDIAFVD